MLGLLKPSEGAVYNYGKIYILITRNGKKIELYFSKYFLIRLHNWKKCTFDFTNKFTDNDKLKLAIKHAQLKKKIDSMPNGIKTIVGNNGIKLSGGERQRVAISRALYQDTEILFLDEFTSALDNQTEKLVMNEIIKILRIKLLYW